LEQVIKADIAIIGGGPAGLAAAYEAANLNARVVVIDEGVRPGGQLIKQIHKFFGSAQHGAGTRGFNLAARLVKDVTALDVSVINGSVVYAVFDEGRKVEFSDSEGTHGLCAKRLIIATGASENAIAFPGWTLPGVMTAGALQTMMNLYRVLPSRRILMVGGGNVGLIVAYQALQAGAEVVALVEAAPQVGGYMVHANKLKRIGVPIFTNTTISRIDGDDQVRRVEIVSLSETKQRLFGSERWLDTDLVCLSVGLSPLVELPSMAGCKLEYHPALGGFVPWHDTKMRTSLENIYVAGDVSGVEEASTAIEQGRLAGIGAAESLGLISAANAELSCLEIRGRLSELRSGPKGKRVALAKASLSGESKTDNAPTACAVAPKERPELNRGCYATHAIAIIECPEQIPCDPCMRACPCGAISMQGGIADRPVLDPEKCTGCGSCIACCPGLAIYVLDKQHAVGLASISVPFELLPVPAEGDPVEVVDRVGDLLCRGRVLKVRMSQSYDHTSVIKVELPVAYADAARYIRRIKDE
jgi:NADPH-dependent 2,4-dienoyl-CoA reductase/sulfur reductase-like enzyme/Fe-S-cluster-containing hydrogenase component 2